MAFVNYVVNNPGYSSVERTVTTGVDGAPGETLVGVAVAVITPSHLQGLFSPAINTSGLVKPIGGWLAYATGGGEFDEARFLYPRGY